jgi:hypothetical protein
VVLIGMGESAAQALEHDYAVTAYYGRMTGVHSWHDIILHPGDVDLKDVRLLTGALSWTFARYLDNALNN